MTFEEIQAQVCEMKSLLEDRTNAAGCEFRVHHNARPSVAVYGDAGVVGDHGVKYFGADDPEGALQRARAFIMSLPGGDKRALHKYQMDLAHALDEAAESGVDETYLKGARSSLSVASEALLPAPVDA